MKSSRVYLSISILLLILFCIVSSVSAKTLWDEIREKGVLEVGVAACDPHCIQDPSTGEWSGTAVDITKRLAEVLGVEFKPVSTTWDYIIAGLQAKKWDIALALNATPDRSLAVDFSIPFVEVQLTLVYHKDNPKIPKNPNFSDFDQPGIDIAVMSGTANEKTITRAAKNANILRFPDLSESRMAIISNRADALIDDNTTNYLFALANKDWALIAIPNPPLGREGICFGFRQGYYPDIETMNIVITQMKDSGEIKLLEEKYGTMLYEEQLKAKP